MKVSIRKPVRKILVYGFENDEFAALENSAAKENIACIAVDDSRTSLKVGQLLSENNPAPADALALKGKYALLSGFEGDIEGGLSMINAAAKGVIKAVATKHNTEWKFAELCAAIREEHIAMTGKK